MQVYELFLRHLVDEKSDIQDLIEMKKWKMKNE